MRKVNKFKKISGYHLPTLIKTQTNKIFPSAFSKSAFKVKNASLNITDRCNLRCVMCKQWRQEKKEELSTEQWQDVICQLKEEGIEEVNFTGGEPLLKEGILELAKHASSLGITCGITTNGYLLDERTINNLMESGVGIFTLSLDALGNDYDKIRGVEGAFKRIESALKTLSNIRKNNNISATVSLVLMKSTLKHLKSVVDFCRYLSIPIVICLLDKTPYIFDLGTNQDKLWIKDEDMPELKNAQELLVKNKMDNGKLIYNSFSDIRFFDNYFKDPVQKQIPCVVSQTRIFIDSQGDVYGGCWSMGSFGNLREMTLREITDSEKFRSVHKNMFFKKCPGCSCGYATNLRYDLKSLITDIIFESFTLTKKGGNKWA